MSLQTEPSQSAIPMDAEDENATENPIAGCSNVISNTKTSPSSDKNNKDANELKTTQVGVKPVGDSKSEPGQGAQKGSSVTPTSPKPTPVGEASASTSVTNNTTKGPDPKSSTIPIKEEATSPSDVGEPALVGARDTVPSDEGESTTVGVRTTVPS